MYSPVKPGKCTKEVAGTRWVLSWKMVEGVKTVKARLVAKGYQDPTLKEGLVETSGCVSVRPSHLQVVSLAALRGTSTPSSRFSKRMDLHVMCLFNPRLNGFRGIPVVSGN